jgi:hypothetical protein
MSDETVQIPVALQDRFEAEVRAAYKEHEKESRRNLEIRTAFCATLSALGAGSIAVAASIGMALTAKPQLLSGSLHATAHGLVVITIFLWVSLVCAVTHNFLVVHIAKLESEYSGHEFVRVIIRRALAMVRDGGAAESLVHLDRLTDDAQVQPLSQQQQTVRRREFLHPCATVSAYVSMGSFLAAYTLVAFYVLRLWGITR